MRRYSVLVSIGAAVAATTLVSAGAAADVDHANEGQGDVYTIDNIGQPLPSTQSTNVDVKGHTVKHTKSAIKIKTKYADLEEPESGDEITLQTDLKVKGGGDFGFNAGGRKGAKSGKAYFFKNGVPATCKGMHVKFDYGKNTLTATLPRKCIGNPVWIRYYSRASFDRSGDSYFYDIIGITASGVGQNAHYSGKLRKG